MKTTKVTATIARALAEMALSKIKKDNEARAEANKEKALRFADVKKAQAIRKEQSKLDEQVRKLTTTAAKKFDVTINVHSDASVSVYANRKSLPSIDDLKNEIIIKSHVDNIDSSKIIDALVAKYK